MAEQDWTGKSKGKKTGYQIFVFLLRFSGLRVAYSLLVFVAFYYLLTSRNSNRAIYQYFRQIGFGKLKSSYSVYLNYFVFGQCLLDKIAAMAGIKTNFKFDFEGEVNLHKMVNQGKGGILLSAHVGNWEIAGHYLDRIDAAVSIVMYDAEYQAIKEYLDRVTGKRKTRVIPIKEDMSHLFEIKTALENKELVCIHADRLLPGSKRSLQIPFMGKNAEFPYSIFRMIIMLQAPVSFVFSFKESANSYHFSATEIMQFDGDRDDELKKLSGSFVAELENRLRQFPLQWFNYYDFWKA
ncbi:MAG: lipid A biosynthesis acyltransferase [Bacteroidetes bacterium]|nr:lipid A biosynthesis acyltransferase [Bacteroidota bacterium]